MSLTQRVKQGFLRLPFPKKAVLFSSAALMISTITPWYDERNSFGIGETYLGVEGPLFLIGLLILSFGAVSFFNLFLPLMGKNFFNLRRKGGSVALFLGFQALLLLAVANSVFYHPDFGLNLSNKGTRFGMMAAFFSVGAMILSGYLTRRKESEGSEDMEEFMESPISSPTPVAHTASPHWSQTPAPTRIPVQENSLSSSTPSTPPSPSSVDPLSLDARTRYRMMQSQQRYSANARGNLWGSGTGGPYGRRVETDTREQSMDF